MSFLRFTIDQAPQALERARAGRGGHHYTPAKSRAWEEVVRLSASRAMRAAQLLPISGPLSLLVEFVMPIPASWSRTARAEALDGTRHPAGRPDLSNLLKAVEDGMQGVVYPDDAQICALIASKIYGPAAGVNVCVVQAPGPLAFMHLISDGIEDYH